MCQKLDLKSCVLSNDCEYNYVARDGPKENVREISYPKNITKSTPLTKRKGTEASGMTYQ